MHTTYYYIADKLLKINKNLNVISIALFSPSWYKGREYTKLAPTKQILKDYKDGTIDEQTYIYRYYEEILDKLDAEQIYDELGKDAILVCWEGSDKFCQDRKSVV